MENHLIYYSSIIYTTNHDLYFTAFSSIPPHFRASRPGHRNLPSISEGRIYVYIRHLSGYSGTGRKGELLPCSGEIFEATTAPLLRGAPRRGEGNCDPSGLLLPPAQNQPLRVPVRRAQPRGRNRPASIAPARNSPQRRRRWRGARSGYPCWRRSWK